MTFPIRTYQFQQKIHSIDYIEGHRGNLYDRYKDFLATYVRKSFAFKVLWICELLRLFANHQRSHQFSIPITADVTEFRLSLRFIRLIHGQWWNRELLVIQVKSEVHSNLEACWISSKASYEV